MAKRKAKPRERGEGSIYQRKSDGRFVGQLCVTIDGTTKKRPVYGKTELEVEKKLNMLLRAKEQGLLVGTAIETVEQYLTRWLEDTVCRTVRPTTYRSYGSHIRNHMLPAFGKKPITDLDRDDVQRMLNTMSDKGRGQTLMINTRGVLSMALKPLVATDVLRRNPTEYTTIPRPSKPKPKRPTIDVEMAYRILEATAASTIRSEVFVTLMTGLRSGELRALTWPDVDLDGAVLSVNKTLTVLGGVFSIGEPKTAAGVRDIPLDPELIDELRYHKVRQMEQRLRAGTAWIDRNLVFPGKDGNYKHRESLVRSLRRVLKRAGLPQHFTWHGLRHGFASMSGEKGIGPVVVRDLMGHANIQTTLQVYTHASKQAKREAIEGLGRTLRKKEAG